MADNTNNLPYPFQFDPSQWSNPYSAYKGAAFPATSYSGTPTDAHGNPIGSYQAVLAAQNAAQAAQAPQAAMPPSTTLNSNPFANVQIPQGQNTAVAQPRGGMTPAAWQALSPAQRSAAQGSMAQYASGLGMMPSGNNFVASGNNPSGANPQASTALALMNAGGSGFNQMANQPAAPAASAAPAGPDMSAAYLAALQNPGHVTTPGATVPQSPTPSGQSNVLQQFLANWNQKGQPTTGAGNYNNAGFYNALQGNV